MHDPGYIGVEWPFSEDGSDCSVLRKHAEKRYVTLGCICEEFLKIGIV